MPRYRQIERQQALQENRQALLQAAAEEFARHGYHAANINRISQSAGFSKGTVYNYFDSKQALMQALIEDTAELHRRYIVDRVLQEDGAGQRLEVFFRAGFDFVREYLPRGKAIVNNLYGPEAGFKGEMYQAYRPMFAFVAQEILALGVAQGVFRAVDPASTASLVMLIYLGVASQVDEDGSPWVEAKRVADFARNALRPPAGGQAREG